MEMDEGRHLRVAEYLRLVNDTLALIPSDQVFIVGEISDYRVSQGKWINFDLKDEEEEAKIPCFATTFQLKTPLEAGMRVQVKGYAKVYERFGRFSLNVQSVELVGEGALQKAYELLKKKLEAEGLFDPARKRSLPRFPKRIGLITSTEAAAYGDFLRILGNRWGGVDVLHTPVHVQGQFAVQDILEAFARFQELPEDEQPEVLILTRGGGSLEDLHAFNDEMVARAVYQSRIPVVVGVGHERDESLCDFVADVRASTPSNAAEIVVPNRLDLEREYQMMVDRMDMQFERTIQEQNRKIEKSTRIFDRFIEQKVRDLQIRLERFGYAFEHFRLALVHTRQYIEREESLILRVYQEVLERSHQRLHDLTRIFESFHVDQILKRGFSIIRKGDKIIRHSEELQSGDQVDIQLSDGTIKAQIET